MRQLFISYARENRPDVEALVRDLHALGHQTWLDSSLRGGQTWWHEILRRIADSDVFLAILSSHTLSSVACKRELEWALALEKPVLPLAVEDLPTALPRTLSMRQIVDYSQAGREAAFALAGALGTLPPAPPLPEQLPEAPAAPLSYLSDLVEQVGQPDPLTQQQQHQILIELEPALHSADAEERRGGRYVLTMFSRRGDLYADVYRSLSHMDLDDRDPAPADTRDVAEEVAAQHSAPPEPAAEPRGNLLADPRWADALSAYFAGRWDEAVQHFEALHASYPEEGRVGTRLKESRRQRDIDGWVRRAETAAAEGDWDTAVTAWESLTALDPTFPQLTDRLEKARDAQRCNALVDEIRALHQAGRWDAVLAAARELARIDPDGADPDGIVSDARARAREIELGSRYGQAMNHLDQEHWQEAADVLATIVRDRPGFRDAAALLDTTRRKLPETTDSSPSTSAPSEPPRDRRKRTRAIAAVAAIGVVLIGGVIAVTVVGNPESSNTAAVTSAAPTTTAPRPPPPAPFDGPNETIANYLRKNAIQRTTITQGAPGAPVVDLPVPDGWTRLPVGPGASYGGIVFETPADPRDPPRITATVEKLTGNVDVNRLLGVAPGEIRNLPGYDGSAGENGSLSEHPASMLGGSYTKDGVRRMIAQNIVAMQAPDGVYLLNLTAEGPEADADALMAATGVIVAQTKISL